jgi:hypothetical protein
VLELIEQAEQAAFRFAASLIRIPIATGGSSHQGIIVDVRAADARAISTI